MSRKLNYYGSYSSFKGLFDLFGSGLAGYFLHKENNLYNGACVKVRRSSDDLEEDIYFTNNYLDTSSLISFVGSSSGYISKWYDQSGNGYDSINPNNTQQPKIVDNGSLIMENGNPTIQFDGVNDYLYSTLPTFNSSFSLFSVCKATELAQAPIVGNFGDPIFGASIGNVNNKFRVQNSASSAGIYNDSMLSTQAIQTVVRSVLNDINWNENNIDKQTLNKNGDFNLKSIGGRVGAFSKIYFNGNIQEVIFYNEDKSSDRSDIINYINNKYNAY